MTNEELRAKIADLIDWQPDPKASAYKDSKLQKKLENDGGFVAVMCEIYEFVERFPFMPMTGISEQMGYKEHHHTLRKYIKQNPRYEAELDNMRSAVIKDEAVLPAIANILEIIRDYKAYLSGGKMKLVMWAHDIVLAHAEGKALGFSGERAGANQIVVIDRTKKLPDFTPEDLSDV